MVVDFLLESQQCISHESLQHRTVLCYVFNYLLCTYVLLVNFQKNEEFFLGSIAESNDNVFLSLFLLEFQPSFQLLQHAFSSSFKFNCSPNEYQAHLQSCLQ
jgi:hypothetical protein